MNAYRTTLLAVAASASIATLAIAGPGKEGRGFGGPGKHGPFGDRPTTAVLEMMSKRLELTQEQQDKIAPILEKTREQLKEQAGDAKDVLKETKEQIGAILNDEQKAKLEKGKDAIAGAFGGYLRAHGPEIREHMQGAGQEIALRAAIGSLDLTEEQRTKLKEMQESVQEKRKAIMEEVKPRMEAIEKEVKASMEQILTADQLEQLKEKKADMEKFRKDRPGRGPGHGPGRGPGPDDDNKPAPEN